MACSVCGLEGHNARTCGRVDPAAGALLAKLILFGLAGIFATGLGGCLVCTCLAARAGNTARELAEPPPKPAPGPPQRGEPIDPMVGARPIGPSDDVAAPKPAPAPAAPARPHCCDGTPANCTGRGCCSRHGGVCR